MNTNDRCPSGSLGDGKGGMMLTKQEWIKKYVYKWQGIRNSDTNTVEGGYLFLRNDDGSIVGHSMRNIKSKAGAVTHWYGIFVKAQNGEPAKCNCMYLIQGTHAIGCMTKTSAVQVHP
jgi:hypothetical protein